MLDEHGCHLACCTCYNGKTQGKRKKESRFTGMIFYYEK